VTPSPADVPRRPARFTTGPDGSRPQLVAVADLLPAAAPLPHDVDPQLRITYWNHPCPVCAAWVPKHRAACPGHEEGRVSDGG
jgi:hypothetical protein